MSSRSTTDSTKLGPQSLGYILEATPMSDDAKANLLERMPYCRLQTFLGIAKLKLPDEVKHQFHSKISEGQVSNLWQVPLSD